jgi:hypothetical protein
MDNSKKQYATMADWCCVCKSEEYADHLLHCEIASALSSAIFNHFGLTWVMPRRVIDFLLVGEG